MDKKLIPLFLYGVFPGLNKDIEDVSKQLGLIKDSIWDNQLKKEADEKRRRKNKKRLMDARRSKER